MEVSLHLNMYEFWFYNKKWLFYSTSIIFFLIGHIGEAVPEGEKVSVKAEIVIFL